MAKVRLISITPEAEKLIVYCARVSNPANQDNHETAPKLLAYLLKHGHWSPFEMANMVLEIPTSRAIGRQILRHWTIRPQEFSQRYAAVPSFESFELRYQDQKNRQNSIDDQKGELDSKFRERLDKLQAETMSLYTDMLAEGVAKECARMILPECASTRLYLNGNIRSWIHYLQSRFGKETGSQKEHMEIAEQVREIFQHQLPNVYEALDFMKRGRND